MYTSVELSKIMGTNQTGVTMNKILRQPEVIINALH